MVRHFIIAAWRNMIANRLLSVIAILSLAVGIAAAILMALVVHNQLTFDHFMPDHERTYLAFTRSNPKFAVTRSICTIAPFCHISNPGMAPQLKLSVPEIEAITRLSYFGDFRGAHRVKLQHGGVSAFEALYRADPNVFDVLRLPVLYGDLTTALERPDSIVLPRATAEKYFGSDDVVGQTIAVDDRPMIVRAVIRDLPDNGTELISGIFVSGFPSNSPVTATYLRLRPGASVAAAESRFGAYLKSTGPFYPPEGQLLRLDRINLDEFNNAGIGERLWTAALAGLLVLFIAIVNFVNLTTARAGRREKDVGVRKVCGASRAALIAQFLGEAMLAVILAAVIALAAGEWLLPAVNAFLRTGAQLDSFGISLLPLLLAGVLICSLAAGAYPAFLLSAFRPASALRGWTAISGSAGLIRSLLVALQFSLLIILAIAATIVWQQRDYAMHRALQLDFNRVLVVPITLQAPHPPMANIQAPGACPITFRAEVLKLPGVSDARCTSLGFLEGYTFFSWPSKDTSVINEIGLYQVDLGIFGLYGVRPIAGKLEHDSGAIINLSAVKILGFSSPQAAIGHSWIPATANPIYRKANEGPHSLITAVVPDFGFSSVKGRWLPSLYSPWIQSGDDRALQIKLNGQEVPQTLAAIDKLWAATGQRGPINRIFMADYLAQLYQDMLREAQFFSAFTAIAILLACLGLVGVAVSTAEHRTKEIGIRKSMGATTRGIVTLLLWQFAQPVLWANVIAWPVAWLLMQRWLSGFTYHIDLNPWVFAAVSFIALLIALMTMTGQAWLVARQKPVLALRYE